MSLTFVTTVLAIASPLYVMAIYDRYISSGSLATLGSLVLAMVVALGGGRFSNSSHAPFSTRWIPDRCSCWESRV